MALNANAMTTLAMLEAELGLPAGKEALVLERLINGISTAIEKYCKRTFARAVLVDERYAGYGTQRLMLKRTPVVSVEGITLDGATVDATGYYIDDAEAGFLFRAEGWANTAALSADVAPRYVPGTEEKAFKVSYTAGYLMPGVTSRNLPDDLEQACVIGCVSLYRGRGKYQKLNEETESGDAKLWYDYPLPPNARQLLNPYRRVS